MDNKLFSNTAPAFLASESVLTKFARPISNARETSKEYIGGKVSERESFAAGNLDFVATTFESRP